MIDPEKLTDLRCRLHEQQNKPLPKTGTATQAFCKVCDRPVNKLPHQHDEKVKINPNRRAM